MAADCGSKKSQSSTIDGAKHEKLKAERSKELSTNRRKRKTKFD